MISFEKKENELEDQALIQTALDGSSKALEALIKRHQRFIYNLSLKMVGEADDAADLTQEILIKVVTKLGQYRADSSFTTWLYRMATNHFIDATRKKSEIQVNSFEDFFGLHR